jgi:hypothetical protein
MLEFRVLEDARAVRGSTTGEAADTSVNMSRSGNLNIPDGEAESGKYL